VWCKERQGHIYRGWEWDWGWSGQWESEAQVVGGSGWVAGVAGEV